MVYQFLSWMHKTLLSSHQLKSQINFILVFLEVLANHSVFLQFGFRTCFSFREEINCHEFKLLMAESEIGLFHLDVHNISGRENS